ncbi:MAG: hypothetical protein ACRC46_06370 [Thermoguttaceae bacterium]
MTTHPLISHLTPSAAKVLRGDGDAVWHDWGTGVRKRTKPLSEGLEHRLFWGLTETDGEQLEELIAATRSDFVRGAERAVADMFTVAGALATIDVAWQLPRAAGQLVWSEWEAILISLDYILADVEENALVYDSPLLYQILCGELQLTLACLLPDLVATRDRLAIATSSFAHGLETILDGGGMPQSHDLPVLRPLLACWTRSQSLAAQGGCKVFDRRVREQYRWMIEQVLRLTRRDGTAVFSLPTENSSDEVSSTVAMIESAVELSRDDDNIDVALLVLPKRSSLMGRRRDGVRAERLPDSSYLSEWSCVSVMRSGWDFSEASVAVATPAIYVEDVMPPLVAPRDRWSDELFQIELNVRGATLLSGAWRVGVTESASGKPLAATAHWTETGTVSEPGYDYLEWELTLEGGVRIERQIVLAHNEEILLIADTLIPASGKKSGAVPLVYTSSLPVACFGGTTIQCDDRDANEVVLTSPAAVQSRVFPLFLPEWKKSPSVGKFSVARDKSLEIEWKASESGPRGTAFLPVVIDLDKTRLKRPYTWRHLTVGENLRAVTRDEASGYRLACGDDQFLLYRSHTEQRNRTVLGHNLVSELLLAKFSAEDGVEVIAEIGRDE